MGSCCGPNCCMPGLPCAPCPIRVRYVGVPKLGPTLCAQEVDQPSPTMRGRRTRYRSFNPNFKMSVGVLQSIYASNDKALYFDDMEMNGQRYAMCLKALALLHVMPVHRWTNKLLDSLMQEGAELYSLGPDESNRKSGEMAYEREVAASMSSYVYNALEQGIRRAFKLEGYEFEVELGKKFSPKDEDNAAGDAPTDIFVVGLRPALHAFFKKRKYCLLSTTNLYLLIWKEDGIYFVLDFYGRSPQLELRREGGHATLVCLREVRSVDYLITQKSSLGKKDTFILREMRLVMLIDPEGRALMSYSDTNRADEFVRVSRDYAYLKSKLHLSLKEKNPLVAKCGLPVAIAAIITSKIDHPASWDSKTLNKIICYGFFICQCCWEYCKNSQVPIDYDSFPNQLQIGQFAVNLTILPQIAQGVWRCVPRYKSTDLTNAIAKCFQHGQNYLLLTINQQTYAIWKKNGFFYLFDPYRHRLPGNESRSASLRMFGSLEEFFKILNLVLLQSNTKARFFIHRVMVTDIRASIGVECLPSVPKPLSPEDLFEAKSINEGICFREDYKRCWDDLGQLSDDEDEDSVIEEVIEESEKEPPAGEEEGEYDYEDVEWSDDGGGGGRRRRRGGRRGVRGRLGLYGKGGGKGKGGGASYRRGRSGRRGRSKGSDGKDGRGRKRKSSKSRSTSPDGKRRSRSRKGSKSGERGSRRSKSRGSRDSKTGGSKSRRSRKGSRDSSTSGSKRRGSKSRGSKSRGSTDRSGKRGEDSDKDRARKEKGKAGGDEGDGKDGGKDSVKRGQKDGGRGEGEKGDGLRGDGEKLDGDGGDGGRRADRGKFDGGKGDFGRDGADETGGGYGRDGRDGRDDRDGRDGRDISDGGKYGTFGSREDESCFKDRFDDKRSKDDSGLSTAFSQLQEGYVEETVEKRDETVCRPNAYPGYRCIPFNLAVAGSETGTYESICKLLRAGFKYADRVLTMTPFGNFVVFRGCSMFKKTYFVFDGCTCNVERFRHLDLNYGTAGLICFNSLHCAIRYILDTRSLRRCLRKNHAQVVDEICMDYCK